MRARFLLGAIEAAVGRFRPIGLSMTTVLFACAVILPFGFSRVIVSPAAGQTVEPVPSLRTRHVLLINSYQPGYQWSDDLVRGVREVMENQPFPVELWIEYLDSRRLSGAGRDDRFEHFLRDKYQERAFDLILSSDDAALTFVIERRDRLFPGVPVVFMGLNNRDLLTHLDRRVFTGLIEIFHTETLISTAQSLWPETKRFVVIGDAQATAQAQLNSIRAFAADHPDLRFDFYDGSRIALEEILAALGKTTRSDAIVTTMFTRDHTGRYFPPQEAILRILASANGPVFSESACDLGQGVLACVLNMGVRHGERGAQKAAAVLAGRSPATIPIESSSGARVVIDYREQHRWGIDARRLPADAEVVHAPGSFYEANKTLIWGGVSFIMFQALVIGALVMNITRRRQVEGELATQANELAVSNADLQAVNESLRKEMTERQHAEEQLRQAQKMEAIGRLAGGVAHDFNNLLTVIGGFAYCLVEAISPEHPARRFAEEVQKAGERAAALTKQLLAFGRKQVLSPTTLSLNDVVRKMDPMLHRLLGEDLDLEVALTGEPTTVVIDPGQIEQVIMNLAINARDAMPNGGRLLIETRVQQRDDLPVDEQPEVPTRATTATEEGQSQHVVQLRVRDTGHGLDDHTRSHIFEPFYSTKGVKGTGLGLATVYGIVKQSGGAIAVRSEPAKGATFVISLPRVVTAITPATSATSATSVTPVTHDAGAGPAPAANNHETVLLVEDEPSVRSLAARMLRSQGYRVVEASSGEHAIGQAAELREPIDLLLTDVVMPGMSGRQLAVRLTESQPGLKVLFMSGYTDNVMAQHGVLEPGTELLEKPFTLHSLGDKVRAVLDAR
jgi:signal transduction histidine kinase